MKKRITSALLVLMLTLSLISCGDTKQTNEAEEFTPTPLVIQTEDEEVIPNPVPGTVTIVTPSQESECWYGMIYINPDGEMTRVTLFDAVESSFDEHY